MTTQRTYRPDGETLLKYVMSDAPLVCIQGPVRSGKSVASIMRIYRKMMEVPKTNGKRRSRWLVTRQSYPELLQSTIKTWLEWFPEEIYGRFYNTPPYRHEMRFGDVEAEVVFESFEGEADIPSLKSREYTGIWCNEAQFYSLPFVVALYERTGWYPTPDGPKCLQLDMNAPPLGHWAPMMRGDAPIPDEFTDSEKMALIKPAEWDFLVQPAWFTETFDEKGAVEKYLINPKAENLRIVGERAVIQLLDGRTKNQIDADLMNRVLILTSGRPVFPMFSREDHVAKAPLRPQPGTVVRVGLDFGRQPAMVAAQCIAGRWWVLDELTASNMAAVDFAPIVRRRLALKFPGFEFEFWGDPSGSAKRSETDDETAFKVFEQNGMLVRKFDERGLRPIRIETATSIINRRGGLLISPTCPTIVTALAGGYVYERKRVSGAPTYEEAPKKNQFSHPVDALLEIFMGAGESSSIMGGKRERKAPVATLHKVNPYFRGAAKVGGRMAEVFRR
jgi:hypothetical protein